MLLALGRDALARAHFQLGRSRAGTDYQCPYSPHGNRRARQ
jgi:hypothetical protein